MERPLFVVAAIILLLFISGCTTSELIKSNETTSRRESIEKNSHYGSWLRAGAGGIIGSNDEEIPLSGKGAKVRKRRSAKRYVPPEKAEAGSEDTIIQKKELAADVYNDMSKAERSAIQPSPAPPKKPAVTKLASKKITELTVPEYDSDTARLAQRDAYISKLKKASYAFNTPSTIKVGRTATINFWLDPLKEPEALAEDLKKELMKSPRHRIPKLEAERMEWSPRMRATLTGDDFEITPTEGKSFDGLKDLSCSRRTTWSWDVRAKYPGKRLPLHLKVYAILPKELGEPQEMIKFDRTIYVKATFNWLFNTYWERWKWLLGGLGTVIAALVGWWWNNRRNKLKVN